MPGTHCNGIWNNKRNLLGIYANYKEIRRGMCALDWIGFTNQKNAQESKTCIMQWKLGEKKKRLYCSIVQRVYRVQRKFSFQNVVLLSNVFLFSVFLYFFYVFQLSRFTLLTWNPFQWCSQFNDVGKVGKTQIPIRLIVPASQCGSLIGMCVIE